MIWDSQPWKRGLREDARKLERLSRSPRTARTLFELERTLFVSAYSLRKLADAKKVSNATRSMKVQATAYPRRKETNLAHFNRNDVDRHFLMDCGTPIEMGVTFLCNQLIHSYVFAHVSPRPKRVDGFLVASDWEKVQSIHQVKIEDFIAAMSAFAEDNPREFSWRESQGSETIEVTS